MNGFAPSARGSVRGVLLAVALAAASQSGVVRAAEPTARAWVLDHGEVRAVPESSGSASVGAAASDAVRGFPTGSLLKPFVAQAWAAAHPGEPTPRLRCAGGATCWRPSGHGELGLARALELSCNAYFRALAADTPRELLEAVIADQRFDVPRPLTPDLAIGLTQPGPPEVAVRATPAALLLAFGALARTPWPRGDAVRREVLAGLRESAHVGTAAGLRARGLLAKTGTVPALDGAPLATSGLALAFDESGWAVLLLLDRGTGREAATRLARALPSLRPGTVVAARASPAPVGPLRSAAPVPASPARTAWSWSPAAGLEPPPVRVALFGELAPAALVARNIGAAPAPQRHGFAGPGASLALTPGDTLGPALWDLAVPAFRLNRVVSGSIRVASTSSRVLRPILETPARDYVSGVLAAELPSPEMAALRSDLGAAVLRLLMRGPRHPDADVCDTTHCAWFIGRGPRVSWADPRHPVAIEGRRRDDPTRLALVTPAEWERAKALAREDGPAVWTAHCGGMPLSPHAVWGNGDRRVWVCPRHGTTPTDPWSRTWSNEALARAFGGRVVEMALEEPDGVWTLRVRVAGGASRALRYDEAHRELAAALGWDALPSPATRIAPSASGFRAEGFGHGHRVGLCLAG
ncbi:MAG: hypothetical protein U0610_12160 [bacterium]